MVCWIQTYGLYGWVSCEGHLTIVYRRKLNKRTRARARVCLCVCFEHLNEKIYQSKFYILHCCLNKYIRSRE